MFQRVAGQRWISETEPELGLGTLVDMDGRTICIRFDSSDCTRQYTRKEAPLRRIKFKIGDRVQLKNHTSLTIESLSESGGLVYYSGENTRVCETDLCDTISFSMPQDRLFAGMTDTNKLFDLRYHLLNAKTAYDASPAKGFLGGQVELIPHQVFIADTVSSRYVPRVLLSDETGLGKTIEACLILHKLLLSHRAKRILIVVPESLVHQWFIELYRKFNLSFMVVNEDYCLSLEREGSSINPFLEHQLCIVSIDFLKGKNRRVQILDAGWDMLVIDEAHHITDHEKTNEFIQILARKTFGLMLLTATPEQMGIKNHFRHLQMIDPERYFNFNIYLDETAQYKKTITRVKNGLKKGKEIDHILDSYGPGRVIFRNKRDVIKGFPRRVVHLKALTAGPSQVNGVNQEFYDVNKGHIYDFRDDPRVLYLIDLIKQKKKLLVICSSKEKVEALDKAIARHISIDVAKFDETMSLLQRDRNAAWFSRKDGARILVCSEIGSEGRNFQFVHHLFLFDLPQNPELLEQRIGRVDRIGQKKDIQIHVPYVRGSVYEVLARWYMDGLNLFKKNINGVHFIYRNFEQALKTLFRQSSQDNAIDETFFKKLIAETNSFCIKVDKNLAQGKNILLEMNSFKPESAKKLIDTISRTEKDKDLDHLLTLVLDQYGIETDFFDKTLFKLKSNAMTDEKFPRPKSLSKTMTFDRQTAISRDDVDFFSWDHPFVQQAFEYFLTTNTGSCTTAVLDRQKSPGILLEIVFMLECVAPLHLNLERHLMAAPIRILVDHHGNDITAKNEFATLSGKLSQDKPAWFKDMEQVKQTLIPSMIDKGFAYAEGHSRQMIEKATIRIKHLLGKEIFRLAELKKINPDIREMEIQLARTRMVSLLDHLSSARLRIDSLRLIRVQ